MAKEDMKKWLQKIGKTVKLREKYLKFMMTNKSNQIKITLFMR